MDAQTTTVDLSVGGQPMATFVAWPRGDGAWPSVAVAFEAFGMTDYIKTAATDLAEHGYVVVVPDLYHRLGRLKTASYNEYDVAAAHRLESAPLASRTMMATLRDDELVLDMGAAIDFIKQRSDYLPDRIGVLGFWNGGRVAFLTACHRSDVRAAVSFYGHVIPDELTEYMPVSPLNLLSGLQAATLFLWGKDGQPMTRPTIKTLEDALRAAGKTFDSRLYGAPRGFHNPNAPSYDEQAAADAWARALAWLGQHLQETGTPRQPAITN